MGYKLRTSTWYAQTRGERAAASGMVAHHAAGDGESLVCRLSTYYPSQHGVAGGDVPFGQVGLRPAYIDRGGAAHSGREDVRTNGDLLAALLAVELQRQD